MLNGSDKSADAAKEVIDELDGLSIRFVGRSNFQHLAWQAGQLHSEYRDYRDPGMTTPFEGNVILFHLLGHGFTRDEAIAMARQNPNRRRV